MRCLKQNVIIQTESLTKNSYKIIYSVKDIKKHLYLKELGISPVGFNSFGYFYYIMTSKVIVSNSGGYSYIPLRKEQYVINTHHGGGAYKSSGADMFKPSHFLKSDMLLQANCTDVFLSTNKRFTEVMSRAYYMPNNKFWEIGMPRNDDLINGNEERRVKIREKIGLANDEKLVLYAPTYRKPEDNYYKGSIAIAYDIDMKKVSEDKGFNVYIPGTRDVMIQKVTGIIYSAAPIVFLSISPSGGTVLASVYAVYNNVFNMIKSVLRSIIDAPRLSLGQMFVSNERNAVWNIFCQYEYIAIVSVFLTCTTSYALVLPFITIYTNGITDVNYYDVLIAVLMVLITVFEIIHIPSGHLINMAGEFRISMYFQSIACIALIVTMIIGGIKWGIYGLICSVLLVAILLAIFEIGYVHIVFFKNKWKEFIKIAFPYAVCGCLVAIIEERWIGNIDSYSAFCIYGVILLLVNLLIAFIIGIVFSRDILYGCIKRCKNLINKL